MTKFQVEVRRKVEEKAVLTVKTTSSSKARAVAEYQANEKALEIDWSVIEPAGPVRIKSKIIGEGFDG